MRPARSDRPTRAVISLVPMIDVLLILLVFFMVTSSYLNLDMIKMVEPAGAGAPSQPTSAATPLMIRLAADGQLYVQGQPRDLSALSGLIATKLAQDPSAAIVLLPSARANTQQLVSAMDLATQAGATQLRLIRLEGS